MARGVRLDGVTITDSDASPVATYDGLSTDAASSFWAGRSSPSSSRSSSFRRSASRRATSRIGQTPLTRAPSAATLLAMTEVPTPKPSVKTPITEARLGARIMFQLRWVFLSSRWAISRSAHNLARPCSRKTIWAVSVAMEVAPRSEMDTLAFLSAIESLIPSPTKQTLRPSLWSFST